MGKPKNYISEGAAVETVKRWFAPYPDTDELSLEQVYSVASRAEFDETTNRNWLNNKMNQLKYHNLIKANQTFDAQSRRHKLTHIQLTMKGKVALGRIEGNEVIDKEGGDMSTIPLRRNASLSDVAQAVRDFQEAHQEFEVVFDVKFKGVQPTK